MHSIKLPLFTALAVLSVAACSRNRGGDDVATGGPTPADTVTRTDTARTYPSPTDTVTTPTPRDTVTTPHDTTGMPGPSTMPVDSAQLAMGDSVFEGKVGGANCSSCHGPEAKGSDLGPDLTDSKWIHGDGSLEFIKNIVREGVPTPREFTSAMPAFKESLNEEQITAVASYVHSLNGARVSPPTPSR